MATEQPYTMIKSTHDPISAVRTLTTTILSGFILKNHLVSSLLLLFLASCNSPQGNETNTDIPEKNELTVTNQMMDEDQFWAIIESTKKASNTLDDFAQIIVQKLANMAPAEIIGFHLREQQLRFRSYTSDMWCAGYILNGGCSDDSFEYFRCWVIAQGKMVFYAALENPDSLVHVYSPETEFYDFEDLMYVASEAFEMKTGKDIEQYVNYQKFKTDEGDYPKLEFKWEEDNEVSMKKICPKLMEVVWN